MLERVAAPLPDGILKLMRAFAEDPRPGKIDLGVGVYRNSAGLTPVMQAVRAAEARLIERQDTKSYVGITGDPAFHEALKDLVIGGAAPADRIAACATTGGTGAVRQAFDLVRKTAPNATVWVPSPNWPNHVAILDEVGQRWRAFRHLDHETGALDRTGMAEDLEGLGAGDVLLLHGCCHNPTGVDLTLEDWGRAARLAADRGALPMIDLAYQGFGAGVEEDVQGLRLLLRQVPEALVCISGSKTFGLYRERVGLILALCDNRAARERVVARLSSINRLSYTFPPDHGARVVTMILGDPELRGSWQGELDAMRVRVVAMRKALAHALRAETGSDKLGFLADQRGLFSLLPATPDEMHRLRDEQALYGVEDGRINLAGLTPETVSPAAQAIAAVLG
ncbi:MAG: amino acid aminotransferase [Pseudomonadota bacterium]